MVPECLILILWGSYNPSLAFEAVLNINHDKHNMCPATKYACKYLFVVNVSCLALCNNSIVLRLTVDMKGISVVLRCFPDENEQRCHPLTRKGININNQCNSNKLLLHSNYRIHTLLRDKTPCKSKTIYLK